MIAANELLRILAKFISNLASGRFDIFLIRSAQSEFCTNNSFVPKSNRRPYSKSPNPNTCRFQPDRACQTNST